MARIEVVRGYHGTSKEAAGQILESGFKSSRNEYDWLGDGVYFFEAAPMRAAEWAETHHSSEAAVLECQIRLADCIDLLDIGWYPFFRYAYDAFQQKCKETNVRLPIQKPGLHRLDRAVINYAVALIEQEGTVVRAVRASFREGAPVFPGSFLFDRSHVQIVVRDLSIIEYTRLYET